MGTEIILSAVLEEGQEKLLDDAKEFICDFSDRFSRFLPSNELSALNSAAGQEITASPLMLDFLREAKKMHRETGGIFDPTVIGVLEGIGYDRDFELIRESGGQETADDIDEERIRSQYFSRVSLDGLKIFEHAVQAPKGFRIDTGGNGKGFIVDRAAEKFFPARKIFGSRPAEISCSADIAKTAMIGKWAWRIRKTPKRIFFF